MARRKGATKSKNSGARKHITDISEPLKGNTRLKDDPGGTATTKTKTSHRNMDGSKLISAENHKRNATSTMIDHHNIQHRLNYEKLRSDSPSSIEVDNNSTNSKIVESSISIGTDREAVVATSNSIRDDCKETTSNTMRVTTEKTNITNNNNNNKSSHKNNSSFSNAMTTTMSPTNDHKYLHKKFKRIASATIENSSETTGNVTAEENQQIEERLQPQQQLTQDIKDDFHTFRRSISPISKAASQKCEITAVSKELVKSKTISKTPSSRDQPQFHAVKERSNSLTNTDESVGNSYIIVNGSARLTSPFQTVETVSIADTGYGSDGELKSSAMSSNGSYKLVEAIAQSMINQNVIADHQIINNNVLNLVPGATMLIPSSRNSPSIVNQAQIAFAVRNNSPASDLVQISSKLPLQTQPTLQPPSHSPIQQLQLQSNSLQTHQQLQHMPLQQQNRQSSRNDQQQQQQQHQTVDQNNSGRHSCPFCNLNCTKPSVLQKHIRTHTNERPYQCEKCRFAFKTASNYYKHCRSRTHALRVKGIEPQPEDENSIGSYPDPDPDISNSSSDVLSRTASPLDERTSSPSIQYQSATINALPTQSNQNQKHSVDKPYKPKFHNAALYAKDDLPAQQQKQQQFLQFLQQQQPQHLQQQIIQQSQQFQQQNLSSHQSLHHQQQQQQQQQQHQVQLNSSYRSNQTSTHPAYPNTIRLQHPEVEGSQIFYQSQQHLQHPPQHQHVQLQSQSIKNRIEYVSQQRQQALQAQSSVVQQVPVTVGGSSTFIETNRDPTTTVTIPTLSRSLSGGMPGHQLNVEEHISYLISRNEAIVNKELPLQKKYPKVSGKSKNASTVMSNTNSRLAFTLNNKHQQQQQQQQLQQQLQLQQILPQQLLAQSALLAIPNNVLTAALPSQIQKIATPPSQQSPAAGISSQPQQQRQHVPVLNESGLFQPLNLSKVSEQQSYVDLNRKRVPNDTFQTPATPELIVTSSSSSKSITHPQNPERSIIKHLLLNARGEAIPNGDGDQGIYTCVLCKMEFHSSEDLKCHALNYCQGGPSSAPISPVGSPAFKYSRSNSINVSLPELNNPNSLAKLARSTLLLSKNPRSLAKLAWYQLKTKPSNLVLTQLSVNTNSTPTTVSTSTTPSSSMVSQKLTETPLPSPGPLLGKTPLVEAYNNSERKSDDVIITKMHEESRQFMKSFSPKRLRFDGCLTSSPSSSIAPIEIASPATMNKTYSMCGGDVTPLEKKEEPMKRFFSSGGCMIPLSECPDLENSPKIIRTPLLSGGSFTEISPKPAVSQTSKLMIPIQQVAPNLPLGISLPSMLNAANLTRFQFPPINSITAYNPLTLPPVSMGTILPGSVSHGDKMIPFVPGIPGPNTLSAHLDLPQPKSIDRLEISRNVSPNRKKTPSPLIQGSGTVSMYSSQKQIAFRVDDEMPRASDFIASQRSPRNWVPPTEPPPKKSFNFTRIADNLSPRKSSTEKPSKSPERTPDPPRHFNFDKIERMKNESDTNSSGPNQMIPLHVDVSAASTKEKEQISVSSTATSKSKFLRPTSLPLKPGTFTPKSHHGITPTANTLPLISPETPRPSKNCVQLYLNGHAYTYLGLKSSTKMFYCTVNCPQPSYIANMHRLSMYSVWQVCAENNPHPLGLKPKAVMSLYDSRQRSQSFSTAVIKSTVKIVHSQPTVMTPLENNSGSFYYHQMKSLRADQSVKGDSGKKSNSGSSSSSRLVGGYESSENYTYIRGRGRGRFVCSECGIRCRKPSMLKKHIRTHTDVRPYTCQHCSFSFKTKGNLTKHMQSKTHYKKCLELGINLGPMPEGDGTENDGDTDHQSINSGGGRTSSVPGESDSDEYSDGNEGETESSDTDESKSRHAEHEAARSLLSLSMTPPSHNMSISPNPFSQQLRAQYSIFREQLQSQQFPEGAFHTSNSRSSTDEPLQGSTNRRVVSFTSPKPPFDYQKQEQYFSNPSLNLKPNKEEDTAMKPIDLTKPRKMDYSPRNSVTSITTQSSRISEIVCEVSSESGLMKSLVSNTDKIRPSMEFSFVETADKFNDDLQLQAYLTEQALKHSKMKQSQMNKVFVLPPMTSPSSIPLVSIPSITITDITRVSTPSESLNDTTNTSVSISTCIASTSCTTQTTSSTATRVSIRKESSSDSESPIVAITQSTPALVADSILENGEVDSQSEEVVDEISTSVASKVQTTPSTNSAKSVAYEYLKMTSAESRSNRGEDSDDSSSDQELSATEVGMKPSTDFTGIVPPTVIVGEDGFKSSNEIQPKMVHLTDDGRPVCKICSKTFQKQHQMVLHMNIHYMERKFKCEPCAVSFRTQGHLQKHERSEAHKNKVMMNSTFGVPTTSNPRPFECSDCKVAFRIHGHLAKHLRSKTHVQKLECLQKLPFGTYAEIERAGISLTEIDTTDCDNSLASLKELAQRLIERDPTKMGTYTKPSSIDGGANSHESGSEDSPETLVNDTSQELGSAIVSNIGSGSSVDSLVGVKRKFDALCSSGNSDSIVTSQTIELATAADVISEKRVRTNSDP